MPSLHISPDDSGCTRLCVALYQLQPFHLPVPQWLCSLLYYICGAKWCSLNRVFIKYISQLEVQVSSLTFDLSSHHRCTLSASLTSHAHPTEPRLQQSQAPCPFQRDRNTRQKGSHRTLARTWDQEGVIFIPSFFKHTSFPRQLFFLTLLQFVAR